MVARGRFGRIGDRAKLIAVAAAGDRPGALGRALLAAAGVRRDTIRWWQWRLLFGGIKGVAGTVPKPTSRNMRQFSESIPARRAINCITNPIAGLPWVVQPNEDVPKGKILSPATAAHITQATAALKRPNADDTFKSFVEQIVEDQCVAGGGTFEFAKAPDPERPFRLWPFDAFTLRINPAWSGDPNEARYSQDLSAIGGYVSVLNLVPLLNEQVLYIRANPRTQTPFGLSPLEVSFNIINAFLSGHDYGRKKAGNELPEYMIHLGENIDSSEVDAFRSKWENEYVGTGDVPIIGGGKEPTSIPLNSGQRADPLNLKWLELQLRLVAIGFDLTPMSMGIERDVNRSTSKTQQHQQDIEAIKPFATAIEECITYQVLHDRMGWTDVAFKFTIMDEDDEKKAKVITDLVDRDLLFLDEARDEIGRDAYPDGRGAMTLDEFKAKVQTEAILGAGSAEPPEDKALNDELAKPEKPEPNGHDKNAET